MALDLRTIDWHAAHRRWLVTFCVAPDGERPTAANTVERKAYLCTLLPGCLEPLHLPAVRLYPRSHPDYPYVKFGREYEY